MTMRPRLARFIDFLGARLSSEGLFGLHLTVGGAVLVSSAWLFGGVAEDLITKDPLTYVVAAVAAGTAWLAICLTAVETLRRHRHSDHAAEFSKGGMEVHA